MDKNNFKTTEENKPFILRRADPYIHRHTDGNYYFTASVPEYDRIILRRSTDLDGLETAEEQIIWKKHDSGVMSKHIWAPELHYIQNNWYIYFAAGRTDDIWAIRPYILKCTGPDPILDAWIELGQMKAADPYTFQDFSLDMTVFECKKSGMRYGRKK